MDTIEKLIKALEEAKADLTKNMNQSYTGSTPNQVSPGMAKEEEVKPPKDKDQRIKDRLDVIEQTEKAEIIRPDKGYGKIIGVGMPKPASTTSPYGKVIIKSNGQWGLDKAEEQMYKDSFNPAHAPKDAKVKELKAQVKAGTYKPDAGKIADKMISSPEKPLK